MKNLILGLLLFSSIAIAHEYEFRDANGFVQAIIESDDTNLTIRDTNGFAIGTIDSDGNLRDINGFKVGELED